MATARTVSTRATNRPQLEAQIAELRGEIENISKGLKARGIDLAEEVSDAADDFAMSARRNAISAVRQVQHQSAAVAETVKEHPVYASAAVSSIIAVGFAIGYLLAATSDQKKRFFW